MDNPLYHVLLEGRRMGPYDRRTIVGMRIKKALTSADVVVAANGMQLTVADLVKIGREAERPFQPSRSGSYSIVQALHSGALVRAEPGPFEIPAFRGEIEVRVQTKALRFSGRYRQGFSSKEGRVKIPLEHVVHARARGSLVDIALRMTPGALLQLMTLEMFTPEVAAGFVECLHAADAWPVNLAAPTEPKRPAGGANPLAWAAIVGTVVMVAGVLVWALSRS